MSTTTTAPATAAEAAQNLQDATDERDALDRRFQIGDPPSQAEWTSALSAVEYAALSLRGLTAKEQSESVVSARKSALTLRKRYRREIGKQLGAIVAAEIEVARAARALIEVVSVHNRETLSISAEVRALQPAHLPPDAPPDWIKNALKFSGSVPPQINASQLIQSALHDSLRGAETLLGRDREFLRSLEGPGLNESKRVRDLAKTLEVKEDKPDGISEGRVQSSGRGIQSGHG